MTDVLFRGAIKRRRIEDRDTTHPQHAEDDTKIKKDLRQGGEAIGHKHFDERYVLVWNNNAIVEVPCQK